VGPSGRRGSTRPHRNAQSQVYPGGTLSLIKYLRRRPTDAVFPNALCSFILSHPLLLSCPSMSDNPRDATNPDATINSHSYDETVTPVPEKGKAGASWQDSEEQILPENRLRIVFPGLMCCIFLAALDQVGNLFCQSSLLVTDCRLIDYRCYRFTHHRRASWRREKLQLGRQVRHSFPRVARFHSTPASSYLLAASALAPLYGKLSDLIGRKPVLYFAILSFLVCFRNEIVYASSHTCPYSMISIVGFRALRRCKKFDLAHYLSGRPRNGWWWPHAACYDRHI
jgi:hypothetical protein